MVKYAVFAAALLGLAGPAAAKDITGVWQAQSRNAHVEISRCGDAYCGKILSASPAKSNPDLLDVHNKNPELRSRHMIGQTLIEGFKGGPDKWTGGRVYNPGDGNFYKGVITLVDENHLQLKGCVLMGLICKAQTWTRITSE